ncbi:Zonadhesin [Trichinella spiralis]|uniref:Zonadhesin n=1 Tax=Trichinella spiralis TaxID=6334 RepID=A0ABR3KIH2_TRISP
MMIEKDISSKKQKSKLEDEIVQWTPEVKAQATESNRLIDRMSRIRLSEKEKKAAERIGEEQSRKEKKKSKKKSKSKKSKKNETELTLKQHMNKQTHETEIAVMEAPTATEITAAVGDEAVIVQPITVERKPDVFIQEVQKTEKKDSKKIKKKSKKRTKSKKTKKTEKDIAAKEAASSQIPETDITSPKLTPASEVTAINVDQLDIVSPIAEETDKKPEITDKPKGEKKVSKKIKKKSKKRSKSKKTKKTDKGTAAKEAASSQIPETDITSPKLALASEVTAVDADQPNIVPPIAEETAEKPVIPVEPKGEKKDSKKIKKKSKKRSQSKKTKKTEKDTAAKEAASSQVTETDNKSPKFTLASEVTAVDVEQPVIVPRNARDAVKKLVINDEPKGEKKDSKKIKKRSKKLSKSKKSNKSVEDKVAK